MRLSDIVGREKAAYLTLQESFAAETFVGMQGEFSFAPGSGDPVCKMRVRQVQGGGERKNVGVYSSSGVAFLAGAELVFGLPGESFALSPGSSSVGGSLTGFKICEPSTFTQLNYSTNLCE